jgi:hypothetical protein
MHTISSLIELLKADHPSVTFVLSDTFSWSPDIKTIQYDPSGHTAELLHEVGHAILGHSSYTLDISLLRMEREAWDIASKELSAKYLVPIPADFVEEHLDSYREWLHARSTCPSCSANGLQIDTKLYRCSACHTTWRVNEARLCRLKRYKIHP